MKILDNRFLAELASKARSSPRLRAHHNLHESFDEPCQRLVIAMESGSYLQPHRHLVHPKPELFIVLRGLVAVLIFSDAGDIISSHALSSNSGISGFEVPPGTWHTVVSFAEGSAFVEVKPGPFQPIPPEDWAPWAPAEGTPGAPGYLETISAEAGRISGIQH
jgi:cupin fold WbuC family metalloprotein